MSWAEIKSAINSNLKEPLDKLIKEKTLQINSNLDVPLNELNSNMEIYKTEAKHFFNSMQPGEEAEIVNISSDKGGRVDEIYLEGSIALSSNNYGKDFVCKIIVDDKDFCEFYYSFIAATSGSQRINGIGFVKRDELISINAYIYSSVGTLYRSVREFANNKITDRLQASTSLTNFVVPLKDNIRFKKNIKIKIKCDASTGNFSSSYFTAKMYYVLND